MQQVSCILIGIRVLLLAAMFCTAGCGGEPDPVDAGPVAAAVFGEMAGGGALGSGDLAGKAVLLNFWATWCAPCVASNPQVQALHERFAGDDRVAVVGVHTDALPGVTDYMHKHGYTFPTLVDGTRVAKAFGVEGAPAFLVLNADGKVAYRLDGYEPGDETKWARALETVLAGKPVSFDEGASVVTPLPASP